MLIVLPSGWDWKVMVLMSSPAEGAISSVSEGAKKACMPSRMARASGVFARASTSSRFAADGWVNSGNSREEGLQSGVDAGVVADLAHGVSVV